MRDLVVIFINTIMDKYITSFENCSIWQLSKAGLLSLSKFVVNENYKHHKILTDNTQKKREEVMAVYREEIQYFSKSNIFVAKNRQNEIIGTIRIMEWNRNDELPITKIFGIKELDDISPENSSAHIWHVGRFAVRSDLGTHGIQLFRILMMYAIMPIMQYEKGIMFAECDSKLFRIVNQLGFRAIALNEGIPYLGSDTIPMYSTRDGMLEFVERNMNLLLDKKENVKDNLPHLFSTFMNRLRA